MTSLCVEVVGLFIYQVLLSTHTVNDGNRDHWGCINVHISSPLPTGPDQPGRLRQIFRNHTRAQVGLGRRGINCSGTMEKKTLCFKAAAMDYTLNKLRNETKTHHSLSFISIDWFTSIWMDDMTNKWWKMNMKVFVRWVSAFSLDSRSQRVFFNVNTVAYHITVVRL